MLAALEEVLLHPLGQTAAILGVGMGIEVGDHPGLGVACVTLDGLDITTTDLELDGGAAMPQAVEDYTGKVVLLNELPQLVSDLMLFVGSAVLVGEDHVVVRVGSSQKLLVRLLSVFHIL